METTYYSQFGQDRLLDRAVFRGMQNGTFVDVGAHDGVTFSNTAVFERAYGWTGLCIEPNPAVFSQLVASRKARCLNNAVGDVEATLPFHRITGYAEMLSGLVGVSDEHRERRIRSDLAEHGGTIETIHVATRRLDHILAENHLREIDYLSIDTEGSELPILRSLDHSKVFIHVIGAECSADALPALADAIGPLFQFARLHFTDAFFINRRSSHMKRVSDLRRHSMLQRVGRRFNRARRFLKA